MKTLFALAAFLFCLTAYSNPIPVGPEYDTLDDLLAHNTVDNIVSKSYVVKGRHAVGDGLEGLFYWVAGSTAPTNNASVFAWGTGRLFKMARWDQVTPMDFGAVIGGVVDCAPAIQATIDAVSAMGPTNVVYFPPGVYLCNSSLNVSQPITLFGDNMNGKFQQTVTVGPEIRYTGTDYALYLNTYRARVWGIRFTSTANATYGIKMKGEESYLDHVVVGSDIGYGFKIGIYAENASLGHINDCISSDNTQIGVQLDNVTGACSGFLMDRLHVYNVPIGIKLSVNLNIKISSLIEESCQKGIYWDNTAAHGEGLTAQNIIIDGAKYLQVPSAPPAFYTEGRFLYFDAAPASGRFMSIRNLVVRDCFVDNQAATYDVEARFGSNVPLISGVIFENTHFIGSTNSVVVSDNGLFTPIFLNNTMVAPRTVSGTNGAALFPSPFWVQGNGSVVIGNATNQIRFLADTSGAIFFQPGIGATDPNATLTLDLRDTAATPFKQFNVFANTQEYRANEFLIDDTNSVSGFRFVPNSGGVNYIQAGKAGGADTNAILVFSRRDSTNNYSQLHFHGDSTVFWKHDGNTNFWMAPDTGWTGTGTKVYTDNGTFQTGGGGGGTTINPDDGVMPVRYSSSIFVNSGVNIIKTNAGTTNYWTLDADTDPTTPAMIFNGSSGGSITSTVSMFLGGGFSGNLAGGDSSLTVQSGEATLNILGTTYTSINPGIVDGSNVGAAQWNTVNQLNNPTSWLHQWENQGIPQFTIWHDGSFSISSVTNRYSDDGSQLLRDGIPIGGSSSTNWDQVNVGVELVTNGVYAGMLIASNTITLGNTTITNFLPTQTTLTHAGTMTLDLTPLAQHADLSLTGNVTFATANLAQGHEYILFGKNVQATNCTPTFPVGWTNWMGGAPTTITAQKSFVISLLARGSSDSTVWSAYAESP